MYVCVWKNYHLSIFCCCYFNGSNGGGSGGGGGCGVFFIYFSRGIQPACFLLAGIIYLVESFFLPYSGLSEDLFRFKSFGHQPFHLAFFPILLSLSFCLCPQHAIATVPLVLEYFRERERKYLHTYFIWFSGLCKTNRIELNGTNQSTNQPGVK